MRTPLPSLLMLTKCLGRRLDEWFSFMAVAPYCKAGLDDGSGIMSKINDVGRLKLVVHGFYTVSSVSSYIVMLQYVTMCDNM